jgi:hypothetical protein
MSRLTKKPSMGISQDHGDHSDMTGPHSKKPILSTRGQNKPQFLFSDNTLNVEPTARQNQLLSKSP